MNIEVFVENLCDKSNITNKHELLLDFTLESNYKKRKNFRPIIKGKNNSYVYFSNGKKYEFNLLTEDDTKLVLSYDKKILYSEERYYSYLFRTLKYASTLKLIDPKVVVATSNTSILEVIIIHNEKGIEKVIDFSKNMEMNKEDYYDLFNIKEISTLNKFELYMTNNIVIDLNDSKHILEYLIFNKEIFKELSKYYPILISKFDPEGINCKSYSILGDNCDYQFFQEIDSKNKYNNYVIDELDRFTENPNSKSNYISYNEKKEVYSFKYNNKEVFRFKLLSDYITNIEMKNELLSNNRYRECHKNSITVASLLGEEKRSAYITSGRTQINKQDAFFHTWVEIDEMNLVLDYNHNIVMDKPSYYNLFYAKEISRTLFKDYYKYFKTIEYDFGLNFHPMFINYFGKEMYECLEKNKQLIK